MDGETHLGLVLGKPPQRSPVLSEVIATLRDRGIRVELHVQARELSIPVWLSQAHAVALRGLSAPMLRRLENAGGDRTRFIDTPTALLSVRDRTWVHGRLASGGVTVPAHRRATNWSHVLDTVEGEPVVVKAIAGAVGRGRQVIASRDGPLPIGAPFPGPYVIEEHVASDRPEVKLYRFGRRTAALDAATGRRYGDLPEGFEVLAERVAAALELSMCGIDVLDGPRGPTVVDVNPFPSARRLDDAVSMIAGHLTDQLRRRADRPQVGRTRGRRSPATGAVGPR